MGRTDPGREMELRAPEDAPETCRTRRDARGDDPHPSSCTCRLSDCPRPVEEAEAFILPFLHTGEKKLQFLSFEDNCNPQLQVGMWVIPVGLCLRNHWWRFPCVWLAFSGVTGLVTKKCTEKPIDVSLR